MKKEICWSKGAIMDKCDMLDYSKMFEHACAFVDCAEYCETEPNKTKADLSLMQCLEL